MFGLSPVELGLIALVLIVLFGARRLPELGTGLGKAISNFRKSFAEGNAIDVTPKDKDRIDDADASKKDRNDQRTE